MACIDARRGEVFCAGRGDRAPGDRAGRARGSWSGGGDRRAVTAPSAIATSSTAPASPRTTPRCTSRTPATTPRSTSSAGPPEPLLPARSRRRPQPGGEDSRMITAVELRALRTSDLDAIEDRRAGARTRRRGRGRCSPASSRSRAASAWARSRARTCSGYLIVARYVDAWHVMNVAVDPTWRGRGVARALLEQAVRADRRRRRARLHARGARLQPHRHPSVRVARVRGHGRAPRLLHGQSRGRAHHVARPDLATLS